MDSAKFDLDKYYDNSSRGFVLEVDQEYPEELHEFHNDYPLVPDKLDIKREMLSDYQLREIDAKKSNKKTSKQTQTTTATTKTSKVPLYEFYYNYIKNKNGNNRKSRLLFTNTDSLTYEIKTKNV